MVVLDSGDSDLVIIPITSQQRVTAFDLTLRDWHLEGLTVPSFARVHKISVVSKFDMRRAIGRLSDGDLGALREGLRRVFSV